MRRLVARSSTPRTGRASLSQGGSGAWSGRGGRRAQPPGSVGHSFSCIASVSLRTVRRRRIHSTPSASSASRSSTITWRRLSSMCRSIHGNPAAYRAAEYGSSWRNLGDGGNEPSGRGRMRPPRTRDYWSRTRGCRCGGRRRPSASCRVGVSGFPDPARSVGGIGRSVGGRDRCHTGPFSPWTAAYARPPLAGCFRSVPCCAVPGGGTRAPPPPACHPSGLPAPPPAAAPTHVRAHTAAESSKNLKPYGPCVDVKGRGGAEGARRGGTGGGRSRWPRAVDARPPSTTPFYRAGAYGSVNARHAPPALVSPESARTSPPIAETSWCTMASPRPEPLSLRDGPVGRDVEPLEHVGQVLRGDPRPVVLDAQLGHRARPRPTRPPHRHPDRGERVPLSILEQVGDHLLEALRISHHPDRPGTARTTSPPVRDARSQGAAAAITARAAATRSTAPMTSEKRRASRRARSSRSPRGARAGAPRAR